MINKRVLFVINHKAGERKNPELNKVIKHHATIFNYEIDFYELTEQENAILGIKKSIEKFNPTIIAAVGGDGTVNLVSGVLYKQNIALLIVPYGSANGMAKELQIPDQLSDCLDLIIKGKEVAIDLLKINNHLSIHLADVGVNASVVKRFQLDPKRGLFIYAKHLFYEIFVLRRKKFSIQYQHQMRRVKAISITFATATKYGTGAVINPDGKLNDGLFEICIVKPFPKYHLFKIAYQMFKNQLKTSVYFELIQTNKATIICKRSTLLQIDGEIIGKVKEINVEILPKSLKVLISKYLDHPTLIN